MYRINLGRFHPLTMGTNYLAIVCVLLATLQWKAQAEEKCSIGCVGSPSGPTFLSGHKYNYGFEGIVTVYLTGAEKQETSVKLSGQAAVSALGNCGHVLKVNSLTISGPDGKKYNKPPGIEKPVKFSLQDGRIGADICTEEGDSRRSLNIKRAIISLLQTEQKPSTQVDVFGACPTDVTSSQEGNSVLVHRSRNLAHCAHREQGKNDLITGIYNPTAAIKDTQVLQSALNVESKLNSGVPEKVSATEEYLYRPFSIGENGARAKVHTKLTLSGKAGGADNGQFAEVKSIIFELPHGVSTDGSNAQSAVSVVRDTAKTLGSEASSKSAGSFVQVVRILRATSKDDLIKVFNQVKGNSLEKRVFLDGLLRAGTGYSIEASIQILKNKELSPLEQQLVYLSLGNARHVTNEAIKAAATLLDLPDLPKEIYLGVGALAGVYCREHYCHGGNSDGVAALSQKLGAKLQNCKPKSKVEEDYVVAVLKGIHSIRHLEDGLIEKLVHCAADNSVKARVRSAVLEAFQADPCSAKIKKTALDLLKNRQLDSEIRIKAYLAVIQCPCGSSANEIKNLLETEPVHQVGRFITSSLRHIRASSNPDKASAKQHYGLIRTPNKFNIDDRKYSFYREGSFNIDALGFGGNLEQTVIYSQDSFIPRSASFNLTVELFGHNLNAFEVGGRQGNLDRVVEHFLGPKSILRTQKPQAIYDNIVNRYKESEKKLEDGLVRGRRSVKSEVDNFDKHVKAESAPYNNELDLDVYVKLFGTDALFLSLGDEKGFDFNSLIDQFLKLADKGINKVKHFQQEVRGHLLFLDAQLAYPTSTGLPLKLNLIGSATGRLDVSSSVDVRQILQKPEHTKIDIKLVPSTDIEISGLFLVDADVVATGLKVVNNLHSSTGGHLIAKFIENGHGIDLQFGLPIDKQEILTASNDLVFFTAEKGQKEKEIPLKVESDRKEYNGCFDQLSGMLGLTFCGEVSVPFSISGPEAQSSISKYLARYPLTGSSKIKIFIEKNDLKGYHAKGVLHYENPEKRSFELLFEAEGPKNRHTRVGGELINNAEEKTIKLSFDSPIKVLSGQASFFTKPNEYGAVIKAKVDNAEYFGRAGFVVEGNEKRSVFKPVVEYQMPDEQGKQALKIDGECIREVDGPLTKYTLQGIKVNLPKTNEIIDINGQYEVNPKGREFEIKAKKGEHNLILVGFLKGHDAKLEFQNTLNPYLNFRSKGHFEVGETIHNDIDIVYGGDLNNQKNRITLNQLLKYSKKSSQDFSMITKNKFEIHSLPLKLKLESEVDPKKFELDVEGQYVNRKADFKVDARTEIKKPGDYSVKVNLDVDKQGVEVFAKRDIVSQDKSNLENYISVKDFGKYELSGVVNHKNKPGDINFGSIGHLKISGGGKNEDIKFDVGVVENANLYSSHAKISASKGDILDYLLKINRGANANGQLKFVLKDTIAANGQFKVTDKPGKGNGMVIIDFKKIQRKLKGDVKFEVADPTYFADVNVFLNFEKDNNDKVHFTTSTKKTEGAIDSKNKLEYAGKKTELNVHHDGNFEEGKTHSNIEIILPSERLLSFKLDRDLTIKEGTYNGHAELLLSDTEKKGSPPSTISYKAKIGNTNLDKQMLDYEGEVILKLKDGKNLQNTFSIKNVPAGDKNKFDFKSDVSGSLLPKPASLSASAEYSNEESIDGKDSYRVKGSYGSDIGFELIGDDEIRLLEKGDKKYKDDYTLTLRLPFEKAHDIKIVSNTMFLHPYHKDFFEYNVLGSVQVNADQFKVDTNGKIGIRSGFGHIKVSAPHADPFSFDVNYKADLEGEKKSGNIEVKSQYGKGKSASIVVDTTAAAQEYIILIKANAPQAEKLKKLDINIHTKVPSPDTYTTTFTVDADGKVYKYDSQVVYSKTNPLLDVKYTSPTTKPSRFYFKGASLSPTHVKAECKVDNIYDIFFDITSEANIEKDNFMIKTYGNSETFKMNNYNAEISSKDVGNAKRLEIQITNNNKNVLSGSTSFISKQEGPKTIIEGSGSVKVREEQKSANFKYIRTLLTEGNEQGMETFLNLAIGESSYVAEYRVTNLEYKYSYVYCEEKKQCAHADFNSKINIQKPGVYQHLFNMGLDLRKIGFAPEFGLQVTSEVSEKKLPQYNLDLHVNKDDKKYHLHIYSQPEYGKFPAGVTITLPQRILALESLVSYPTDKALPFPIRGEMVLHLDKNKPQQKSAARFMVDVTGNEKLYTGVAEVGFSHPKLGKEAVAKFKGVYQRPDEAHSFKIETVGSIGTEREGKLLLEIKPMELKFLVDTPLVKVVDFEGSAKLKDNLQQADLKFSVLQGKPVRIHAVAKDFQYYEFTTGYSDESERKLSIIGHIEPEKRVDISADIVLPGEKKNIIHGALFLQDNLVKSDYGISKENFNYFVNSLKKDLASLQERIQQLGEKANNEFKNVLKKVEPTYKNLEQAYREELEKLFKDLSDDKVLQEISHALNDIVKFFASIISEVIEKTKPLVDDFTKTITETSKKIGEMYEKEIEPLVKQLYANLGAVVKEYFDGLIDVVAHFAALVTDFFEKHKAELQELANTFAEIFKDLTRILIGQLKEFRTKLSEIYGNVALQIKEMPLVVFVREKLQELAVPEQVLALAHDAHAALRQLLPTEETKNFADALYNYVQKKLRQEKVDDVTELRAIYEKLTVAVTSLVQFVRSQANQLGVPTTLNFNTIPFITGAGHGSAPVFGGSASFSVLNQILKGDVPDPLAIIRAYRPRSLNPLDEVPAKLRAVVVNGQHIFTFDGRHLTFPGNCRYILAHDHVDRNFTLVLQLQGGQPKALVLEDKSGTVIELKENGQVALNGAAHGYPVMEKDVFAFRQANGRIGIGSLYGLMAFCTSKLEVCYIEVSGFYLGKLRGLLGDGNNEPYDDFRLPNGKIVNSESEFGNAYRLASSCPQVKTPEHSAHQHHAALPAACETVFGGTSPLRPLALVLDAAPFRQACIHAVTADSANALHQACDLARGYAALALTGLLPAVLPQACVQCTDGDQPKKIGDNYQFQLPSKQADIVVAVETTKSNEKNYKNLVVPLVAQVIEDLKAKQISDIKVYLVGITTKFPYPIIYDTENNLKSPKVVFDDEGRYRHTPTVTTGCDKFDKIEKTVIDIYDHLRFKLGLTNIIGGYSSILDLPLRPGAVKHTISVVGEKCIDQFFLVEAIRAVTYSVVFEEIAYTHSLVTVTPGLQVGGGKAADQVVGYTDDSVLMLGDKKVSEENEALRQTLENIEDNACAEFVELTNGIVFSATSFEALNPAQQKQYLQTAASAITDIMTKEGLVQDCTCSYVDPFRVRSVCFNKERKALAHRRK